MVTHESTTIRPLTWKVTHCGDAPEPIAVYEVHLFAPSQLSLDAVIEVLDELAYVPSLDTALFVRACQRLSTGALLVIDGPNYEIDRVRVERISTREGWPWRCSCGEARCWHAAVAEGSTEARERLTTGIAPSFVVW
jgi:hypothetical protein